MQVRIRSYQDATAHLIEMEMFANDQERAALSARNEALSTALSVIRHGGGWLAVLRYQDDHTSGDPGHFLLGGDVLNIDPSAPLDANWNDEVSIDFDTALEVQARLRHPKDDRRVLAATHVQGTNKVILTSRTHGALFYVVQLFLGEGAEANAREIAEVGYPDGWDESGAQIVTVAWPTR